MRALGYRSEAAQTDGVAFSGTQPTFERVQLKRDRFFLQEWCGQTQERAPLA
jgi:hypothetical protein